MAVWDKNANQTPSSLLCCVWPFSFGGEDWVLLLHPQLAWHLLCRPGRLDSSSQRLGCLWVKGVQQCSGLYFFRRRKPSSRSS